MKIKATIHCNDGLLVAPSALPFVVVSPRVADAHQRYAARHCWCIHLDLRTAKRPIHTHTHTHTRLTAFSGTTRVSRYQKGKTNRDFTEARNTEWHWHQLGRMQVCTSLQTDNHTSTPPLSFLQVGCPSCRPTNSVKALKAKTLKAKRPIILTSHIHALRILPDPLYECGWAGEW